MYFCAVFRILYTYCHDSEKSSGGLSGLNKVILSSNPFLRRRSLVLLESRLPHNPEVRETSDSEGYMYTLLYQMVVCIRAKLTRMWVPDGNMI